MKDYKSVRMLITMLHDISNGQPVSAATKYFEIGSDDHTNVLDIMTAHARGKLNSVTFTDSAGNVNVLPQKIIEQSALSEEHSDLPADEANRKVLDKILERKEY